MLPLDQGRGTVLVGSTAVGSYHGLRHHPDLEEGRPAVASSASGSCDARRTKEARE